MQNSFKFTKIRQNEKKMNESGNSVKKIVPEGRVWKESSRT